MLACLLVLALLLLVHAVVLEPLRPGRRLLLAPMIGQLAPCIMQMGAAPSVADDPAFRACMRDEGSAAPVIEATLSKVGPRISANGHYELGYTLNVPLLKYVVKKNGVWSIDPAAIERLVRTVAQSDRQLVLYLFSTHFSADAPIESELAQDPRNLAWSPAGPLPMGRHYGMQVFPWSISRTDNELTAWRLRLISQLVRGLCEQPADVRSRISAITVLGETHHLFPDFESGMGFGIPYLVSDYSPESVAGFRVFLQQRYTAIDALNRALGGADYLRFEDVMPPSKDIRSQPLKRFWEHLDAFAAGRIPVEGWLAPDPQLTGQVMVYLDGRFFQQTKADLSRQDVLASLINLPSADVGWRVDLDYWEMKQGWHQVAVLAEAKQGTPFLLGKRTFAVMDRAQTPPARLEWAALPSFRESIKVRASVDMPKDAADFYYNPLATLWQDFRQQQVLSYLRAITKPLEQGCLAKVPRYTHQLFPYANPAWDESKFAVDQSLLGEKGLALGVSLYGEATYGDSFLGWKNAHRIGAYGVTEFHPLRSMFPQELASVFDRHQRSGAQFLSFFLEGRGIFTPAATPKELSIPYWSELNPQNGSDQLYRSLKELMRER